MWVVKMWPRNCFAAFGVVCALTVGIHARAEDGENPGGAGMLQEIVVTAQKRSENINDVGMSITAVGGDSLTKLGVVDLSQFTKITPGFSYQNSVYGTPTYTIRGIGYNDFSMGAEPTVTAYQDQVPLPYPVMTRGAALDIERVEVLKGPQGTLFGENSTGGAVNFIAAKPTSTFHAGADLSYGRFNDAILSGFVSGPLTDALTARLAISHEGANGWQYSVTRPAETNGKKDFTNARLLLDWQPSDALRFELNVNGWHDGGETPAAQFQAFVPKDPPKPQTQFIFDAITAEPVAPANDRAADWQPGFNFARNDNFFSASLRSDWNLNSSIVLTSISAYSHLDANEPIDTDGTTICNFCWTAQRGLLSSLSEELRLANNTGGFKWMIGGNYQQEVADQSDVAVLNSTGLIIPTPQGVFYTDHTLDIVDQQPKTVSEFASLEYALTDQLEAYSSTRFTEQRRSFEGCVADDGAGPHGVRVGIPIGYLSALLSGSPTTVAPGSCITLNSTTFKPGLVTSNLDQNNLAWRGGLNWKPAPDSLLYANLTKGFKAGGYTFVGGSASSEYAPVSQESVLAYEVGLKQSLANRRVEITAAGFYYRYRDKQLLGSNNYPIFGNLPVLVNIPRSYVDGAELNVALRPFEGLTLNGGLTYVHSVVESNPATNTPPLDAFGRLTSYIGEAFPNTPKWQAVADAEYDFPVSQGLVAFIGGNASSRSGSFAIFGDNAQFKLNSYVLVDLRGGVQSSDSRWQVTLWGRNITDKYYWTNTTLLVDSIARLAGDPVTYGVSVRYRY
jgi:iron complex outermembrane recepter protein